MGADCLARLELIQRDVLDHVVGVIRNWNGVFLPKIQDVCMRAEEVIIRTVKGELDDFNFAVRVAIESLRRLARYSGINEVNKV